MQNVSRAYSNTTHKSRTSEGKYSDKIMSTIHMKRVKKHGVIRDMRTSFISAALKAVIHRSFRKSRILVEM